MEFEMTTEIVSCSGAGYTNERYISIDDAIRALQSRFYGAAADLDETEVISIEIERVLQ